MKLENLAKFICKQSHMIELDHMTPFSVTSSKRASPSAVIEARNAGSVHVIKLSQGTKHLFTMCALEDIQKKIHDILDNKGFEVHPFKVSRSNFNNLCPSSSTEWPPHVQAHIKFKIALQDISAEHVKCTCLLSLSVSPGPFDIGIVVISLM